MLGVELSTIDGWRESGCPHWSEGRRVFFDTAKVYDWKLNGAGSRKDAETPTEGEETPLVAPLQQARLNKARADAQEMANAQKRGELVEASEVEATWTQEFQRIRGGLSGLGSKLAPELIGMKTERQMARRIDNETNQLLEELSQPGEG